MSSLLVFNRVYWLEIHSVLVFLTSLVNCCPALNFSLVDLPPSSPPFPVWIIGVWMGMYLWCRGDGIRLLRAKKLQPKKVWKIRSSPLLYVKYQRFSSSILLTCKSVWQITFSGWIFLDYFHRFEISIKFCEFWILICHKRTKKMLGSLSTYMSIIRN